MALAKDSNGNDVQCLRPEAATQRSSITTSSTTASPVSAGVTVLRLCATAQCYFRLNSAASASTACLLPAGVVEYISVLPTDVLNLIGDSTAGHLYITEMS